MKDKTVLGVTLGNLIGLSIFVLILYLLNTFQFDKLGIVSFLNQNLLIIIIMSLLFYLGELFYILKFPFNIFSPPFNAFGGIVLTGFIFQVFYALGVTVIRFLEPFAYVVVFVMVILFGYINIIVHLVPKKENVEVNKTKSRKECDVEWSEIGNEFKLALYNLGKTLKKELKPKK